MRKLMMALGLMVLVVFTASSEAGQPSCLPFDGISRDHRHRTQRGLASWYGKECQGNSTASGEAYNMNGLTAAHPTLPLGTKVRVTNLRNRRSVVLRINDRGPYFGDRLLDVSRAAATRLGFLSRGKAPVKIDVISMPKGAFQRPTCPGATLNSLN
ncbi:MAG TPA: septal ring lytic transglycosylase RlpA family protein [Terriglobia bacterium]|nr:septal ring lytic transglycosylase RlpA family protein [Terriglobia bacterium]